MNLTNNTTKITSESIIQSGLPNEFKKAISEYIWNGFDEKATCIDINFEKNEIDSLISFSIKDNGSGINFNDLGETFGAFLDSKKRYSYDIDGFLKGKKGKGRFSFQLFCTKAIWKTIYKDENSGKHLSYEIQISSDKLNGYNTSDNKIVKSETGTEIVFQNFKISSSVLEDENFVSYLCDEFGWFLFLNRDKGYYIKINGKEIDYKNAFIKCIENESVIINNIQFNISFILWKNKINEKYYYYYLDSNNYYVNKEHTSFNNKLTDFRHSVYVSSEYFDSFHITKDNHPTLGFHKNQSNSTFKELKKYLNILVDNEQKLFVKEKKANELVEKYKSSNVFPKFSKSHYDKLRERDLELVVKELYCLNPAIFNGLNKPQQKTILGFLNLLLDSEQRDSILNILESIIELSDEDRVEFSKVLNKTSIGGITNFVNLMDNRKSVVDILNKLVFELDSFTNERDHIQKLIENNYWLFGEQFHLVSADVNFEKVLNNYLSFYENEGKKPIYKEVITHKDKLKRPDIFICQQRFNSGESLRGGSNIEENIIVELKRPSVVIGRDQYMQIENYIRFIVEEPKFKSPLRKWKLILVGKSVDDFILDKYNSNENKGKQFLVESVPNKNYEIYAYTWEDLNLMFNLTHKHILDAINLQTMNLLDEINSPDILTEMSMNLKVI